MTTILGKDAPLEDSIATMSEGLKRLGFDIEEVSWLNPIPNVWSVHIHDRNCNLLFANGKGMSREAALASALGEFFERLSTNYYFADYFLGADNAAADFVHYPQERWFKVSAKGWPEGLLDEATRNHYDLHGELSPASLIDINSGNAERGICALPFVKQRTDETVWFPVNVIGNLYVSNGMASGNSMWEARVHALSEIFERHIKNTIISSGISLPSIPDAIINRYPRVRAALKSLRNHGFVIEVRDASLGGKFPLVNVSLFHPQSGGCYASFGAHPKFQVALERAVTELLQGRALDQLDQFPMPVFDIEEAAEPHNLEAHFIDSSGVVAWDLFSANTDYPFTEWNIEGDTRAEFEELCRRIHRVDMDIYIADYEHLGFYTCRILVPGMSEIYPVDELIWSNNNAAAHLRPLLLALPDLDQEQYADLYDALDEAGFDEQYQVAELIGIVADAGSPWETLRIGELKCLLALQLEDPQGAFEMSEWLLAFQHLPAPRMRLFRCLHQVLGIELSESRELDSYLSVLERIYTPELVKRCREMIQGQELFSDYGSHDERLKRFKLHQQLLSAWHLLDLAKRSQEKRSQEKPIDS